MHEATPIRLGPGFEAEWPGASALATECVMNLVRAADLAAGLLAAALRPYGLTSAQSQVLSIIHGAGEALPHHVIASRLVAARGTVTFLVDGLEQRGLLRRVPCPGSRRTVLVELTPDAHALLGDFRPAMHAVDRALVADLSREEQETLVALLGRLQSAAVRFEGHPA